MCIRDRVESGYSGNYMEASRPLNEKIISTAERLGKKIHLEDIYTTDVFYPSKETEIIEKYSLKTVEMESFVLVHHAALHQDVYKRQAQSIGREARG